MNSLLSLEELLSAVKGTLAGKAEKINFTSVATDSRNVVKDSLFVPLVGEFQNGHKYIPQAIEKGASVVLINKDEYEMNSAVWAENLAKYPEVAFICVKNTMTGLQDAAEAYVAKFPKLLKICITGSCGKTTTKELMVSVFKAKYGDQVVYTQGNFNSETGLPLSVFNIRENHTVGIFEMGMNRENEIGEISKVLKAKYGVITNIGTAHIGILGSRENIAKEKRKAFEYIPAEGACFVPAEDDFADYCSENVKGKIVKFGKSVSSDISGVEYVADKGLKGTALTVDGLNVNLPLSGIHNYINALGVIACAKECGIEAEYIKQGLEQVAKLNGRMEVEDVVLNNGKKVTLVKDCYNANPESMVKVIEFCNSLEDVGNKIFVLGDMKELGDKAVAAHKEIGQKLAEINPFFAILVGPDMKNAANEVSALSDNFSLYWTAENTTQEFMKIADKILSITNDKDVIVLKGSHSMALENVVPLIVKEGAE